MLSKEIKTLVYGIVSLLVVALAVYTVSFGRSTVVPVRPINTAIPSKSGNIASTNTPYKPSSSSANTSTVTSSPVSASKPKHYSPPRYSSSKGIGLSYDQVIHLLADKFSFQEGEPINGRRCTSGQDGYNGPIIQVIGDHDNIWEAGILIEEPQGDDDSSRSVMLANAGALLLFMKNVSPSWGDGTGWLETAMKRSQQNPGSRVSTMHDGIKYTVLYVAAKSATLLTAERADSSADDILDAIN